MFITSKKKKVFSLVMVVSLISVLLCGIVCGIVFIANTKDREGLTESQIAFGNAINSSKTFSDVASLNGNNLPMDISLDSVLSFNEKYVVFKNNSNKPVVFDLTNRKYLDVAIKFNYDSFVALVGDLILLKDGQLVKVVNLVNSSLVSVFNSCLYSIDSSYILIQANKEPISLNEDFYPEFKDKDLAAVLFDANIGKVIYAKQYADNLLSIQLKDGILVESGKDKTVVYKVNRDLEVVKQFENVGEESSNYNLSSSVNNSDYYFTRYHKVSIVDGSHLFVEKTTIANFDNYNICGTLSNDSEVYYNLEYFFVNIDVNSQIVLVDDNEIYQYCDSKINGYAAIISRTLSDKKLNENGEAFITYYKLKKDKKQGFVLNKVVNYNYSKYGQIVGYNGKALITSGEANSTVIDFDGNEIDFGFESNIRNISQQNYSGAIITKNVLGQKIVNDSKGQKIFNKTFDELSPFIEGYAIARENSRYFRISTKGNIDEILNFASEFEDYVFLGIGYYFAENGALFDVYSFDGKLKYSNSLVSFEINNYSKQLIFSIDSESDKIVRIIKPILSGNLTSAKFNYEFKFATVKLKTAIPATTTSYSLVEDEVVDISNAEIFDETTGGVAKAKYTINKNLNSLSFKQPYDSLTDAEKALIPSFDSGESYIATVGGEDYVFQFDGLYTICGDNFVLAIIRLHTESINLTGENNYYLINFGLKDTYLSSVNVTTTNESAEVSSAKYSLGAIREGALDCSNNVYPAISLRGETITYLDEEVASGRVVSYSSVGFDGGIVFATAPCTSLSFEFVLRNTYYASGLFSEYLDIVDGANYDLGKYSVIVDGETVSVVAKGGYLISGYTIVFAKDSGSLAIPKEDIKTQSINSICSKNIIDKPSDAIYVKINNLSLIERYSTFSLLDDKNNITNILYYFHGYGQDLGKTNPAPLGFSNFKKVTNVAIPEKTGYNFVNYVDADGNEFIKRDGSFNYANVTIVENQYSANIRVFNVELQPKFEGKTFTIFFLDGDQTVGMIDQVKFGGKVGDFAGGQNDLFNYTKEGYIFNGWWYESGTRREITAETIYDIPSNIQVFADLEAKTYTLKFYSNIDKYKDVDVNGYIYDIENVSAIEGIFEEGQTKTITFGEEYGTLPIIKGVGENGENYQFVGWYTESGLVVTNDGVHYNGYEITSETEITADPPILELFAHYVRPTGQVDINVLTSAEYYNENFKPYESLSFDGANSYGGKEDGQTIIAENITNGELFKAYALQGEGVAVDVVTAEGYSVSIQVILYSVSGVSMTYTTTNVIDGVDINIDGRNVNISINKIVNLISNANGYKGAEINLTYQPISYYIDYNPSNYDGNIAEGSTSRSIHYFNVPSNLSTNGYTMKGHEFKGFSKTLGSNHVDFEDGALLDENLSSVTDEVIMLYAVWEKIEYNINYNLNDVSVGNGSSPATIVNAGVNKIKLGDSFTGLPEVSRRGFNLVGWFADLSYTHEIDVDDVFDLNKYNELFAVNSINNNLKTITLYAKYESIKYTLIVNPNDSTEGYGSTSAQGVPSSIEIEFDENFSLPELTRIGYQFLGYKSIRLTSKEAKENTLRYIGAGESAITEINYDIVSDGDYNFEIDDISRTITLYAVYEANTYKIKYNRYFASGYEDKTSIPNAEGSNLREKIIEFDESLTEDYLDYEYVQAFKFEKYYYGQISGGNVLNPISFEEVELGDLINNDVIFTAYYTFQEKQMVNFYYWDIEDSQYVLKENLVDEYTLVKMIEVGGGYSWSYGTKTQNYNNTPGLDGGKLKRLPSPGAGENPVGNALAGFVIANSAPAVGTWYTKDNSSGLKPFDLTVKIEEVVNVYAVYETIEFNLEMNTTSGLQVKTEQKLFDLNDDGSIKEYSYSDVYLIALNQAQFDIYTSEMENSETASIALRLALSDGVDDVNQYDELYRFESSDYKNIEIPSENTYFFAITLKQTEDGKLFVYHVSENYYSLINGTLTNVSVN